MPIYVQFNGQKISGLSENVYFNPRFLVKDAKYAFLKKNGFEWSFISNLSAVGNKPV